MEEIKEACGIKIGEYIRTSGYDSFISKIKRIEFDNEARLFWFVYDKKDFDTNITREWRINKPYIKKHSFNIIDLIEPEDYLDGVRVDIVDKDQDDHVIYAQNYDLPAFDLKNIKSIATKEEFKNIEYKVEK